MRRRVLVVLSIVAVIAGVIILGVIVSTNSNQGAAPTTAPTTSPEQSGEPTEPTDEPVPDGEVHAYDEDGSEYEFEDVTCETVLGSEAASLITTRVFDYERYWIMPDSEEKQAGIELYGTPAYIENQSVYIDPTLELEQGPVSIAETSIFSCRVTDQGNVRVSIIPDIQLHESFDESSPVIETTTGVVHRSVWSLEDGQWRIAYEDWR